MKVMRMEIKWFVASTVYSGPRAPLSDDRLRSRFAYYHNSIQVQLVHLDLHDVSRSQMKNPTDGFTQLAEREWFFFLRRVLTSPISIFGQEVLDLDAVDLQTPYVPFDRGVVWTNEFGSVSLSSL